LDAGARGGGEQVSDIKRHTRCKVCKVQRVRLRKSHSTWTTPDAIERVVS